MEDNKLNNSLEKVVFDIDGVKYYAETHEVDEEITIKKSNLGWGENYKSVKDEKTNIIYWKLIKAGWLF